MVDLAPWHSETSNSGSDSYYSQYYQQMNMSLGHTLSFYSSAVYCNNNPFAPSWMPEFDEGPQYFRRTQGPTYISDHTPLESTPARG